MEQVGIYILTYPGDFHLSVALVRSLRHFNPNIPIMIIPGEGFDRSSHPFDVPIMSDPVGFWRQMGHADRKFWVFQGPFKKFIYLDADIICTRSVQSLLDRIKDQRGKFIFAQMELSNNDWNAAVKNVFHPKHFDCLLRVQKQLGNPELLKSFDPNFDPYAHYPFNDGVFASSKETFSEHHFENLNALERTFYSEFLHKDFNWKSVSLFFGDQGRLNYLVTLNDIPLLSLHPDGHYLWGGRAINVTFEQSLRSITDFAFIHWAGCPRPSPSYFCHYPWLKVLPVVYQDLPKGYSSLREIPGYSHWQHFAEADFHSVLNRLQWSMKDLRKLTKMTSRRVRKFGKKISHHSANAVNNSMH